MINRITKILFVLFITVFLFNGVLATCNIDFDNYEVELRSEEDGYSTNIYAEDNSEVDIRITFEITDITDKSDCDNDIKARAEVFKWDDDNDEWDKIRTTTSKSQELEEDSYTFTWSNEFSVDDRYDRYKVEGYIEEDNDELEREDAFIDVENNTCSGIILKTRDFEIDETEDEKETFIIENNTNKDFEIETVDISFSSSGITAGEIDYPDTVDSDDIENIDITLEAGYVSNDLTRTAIFEVSGYLGNEFCSFNDIGKEEFDVKINDTGASGSSSSSSSSGACDDLELNVKDITLNEGSTTQEIFYLKNDSTKRFEILELEVQSSGVDVEAFYLEKYAFPNNLADIAIIATAGNVTKNKVYENEIKVRGRFSDGKSCSFSSIESKLFDVIVENTTENAVATCSGFAIDVAKQVNLENAGTVEFTIVNGTNRTASINIESELQVTPSVVTLPANSSIKRELSVSAINQEGTIYFAPNVAGCNVNGASVVVKNSAAGTIDSIIINTTVRQDQNSITLINEFNNPTNKFFVGVLSFDGEGWISEDKTITIAPGQSYTEVEITPAGNRQALNGTITFTSNGKTVENDVNLNEGNVFAGLFALGSGITGIGILLLIIIIAVVIVVYIIDNDKKEREIIETRREPWEMY